MGFFSDMLSTSAGEHQVNSTGIRCCATCNNWSGSRRPNCFGSLVEAFEENKTLVELDLSHNCFGEECGKILGTFIGKFQIIYFQKSISVCEFSW